MIMDGIIQRPVVLLALFGALCLLCINISGVYVIQSALAEASGERYSHEWDRDAEDEDTIELRQQAGRRLERKTSAFHEHEKESLLQVQILGINDFHGQISAGRSTWMA